MTVTLELKPEVEARVAAQAAAHGMSVEAYIQSVLESLAITDGQQTGRMTLVEIDQVLDELSEGTEHLPPLPENFSREDIYFDHD